MKKRSVFILIVLGFLTFNNALAQFNKIGGGIVLATGGEYKLNGLSYYNKALGIDLRAEYNFNKKLKVVPDFRFYLPNKEKFTTGGESKTTLLVLNVNAHYILNPRKSYKLYLLGGAHVGAWKIKDDHTSIQTNVDVNSFKFAPGINLGGGMQFKIGNRTEFFAEVKYVIAKTNQLAFSPGFLYEF